jgi:hypothetical protein
MKINMEISVAESVTFSSNRFLIGLVMFSGVVGIAMALGLVVVTFTALFPLEAARSVPDFQFANRR